MLFDPWPIGGMITCEDCLAVILAPRRDHLADIVVAQLVKAKGQTDAAESEEERDGDIDKEVIADLIDAVQAVSVVRCARIDGFVVTFGGHN